MTAGVKTIPHIYVARAANVFLHILKRSSQSSTIPNISTRPAVLDA